MLWDKTISNFIVSLLHAHDLYNVSSSFWYISKFYIIVLYIDEIYVVGGGPSSSLEASTKQDMIHSGTCFV